MGQVSLSEGAIKKAIKRFQQWERERQKKSDPSMAESELFKLSEAQEVFSQWMGHKSFHDLTQAMGREPPGTRSEGHETDRLLSEIAGLAREAKEQSAMLAVAMENPAKSQAADEPDAPKPRKERKERLAAGANPLFAKAGPRGVALACRAQMPSPYDPLARQAQGLLQALGEALEATGQWKGASCHTLRESLAWDKALELALKAGKRNPKVERDLLRRLAPPDFSGEPSESRQRAAYALVAGAVNAALDLWEELEICDPWLAAPSGALLGGQIGWLAREFAQIADQGGPYAGVALRVSDALALVGGGIDSIDVSFSGEQRQLARSAGELREVMSNMRVLIELCPKA